MLKRETLAFLHDLKENNNRTWFQENRHRYESAKADAEQLAADILAHLSIFDTSVAGLSPRECMFRIYRDARFSADKSPYKTNMGFWAAVGGKKSIAAGYYLHIEPAGNSFVAGGSYMPSSEVLSRIRQEIDYHPSDFEAIVCSPSFIAHFGKLSGRQLQRPPKGYAKDHPQIEWLKHCDFIVQQSLSDDTLLEPNIPAKLADIFAAMKPLNDFLNRSIGLEC